MYTEDQESIMEAMASILMNMDINFKDVVASKLILKRAQLQSDLDKFREAFVTELDENWRKQQIKTKQIHESIKTERYNKYVAQSILNRDILSQIFLNGIVEPCIDCSTQNKKCMHVTYHEMRELWLLASTCRLLYENVKQVLKQIGQSITLVIGCGISKVIIVPQMRTHRFHSGDCKDLWCCYKSASVSSTLQIANRTSNDYYHINVWALDCTFSRWTRCNAICGQVLCCRCYSRAWERKVDVFIENYGVQVMNGYRESFLNIIKERFVEMNSSVKPNEGFDPVIAFDSLKLREHDELENFVKEVYDIKIDHQQEMPYLTYLF